VGMGQVFVLPQGRNVRGVTQGLLCETLRSGPDLSGVKKVFMHTLKNEDVGF